MRNEDLANLNFRELLHYGGQPTVQVTYDPPLKCSGYCTACEDKGTVFPNGNGSFDLMSHGCDISDYEALLGPRSNKEVNHRILFLLENPGKDVGLGEVVPFKGYNKKPPIKHYYWTPEDIDKWPIDADYLPYFYGPYFAYLMHKHRLNDVYITNLVKCNTIGGGGYNKPEAICNYVNKWFSRELKIFSPKLVFCFGRKPEKEFKRFSGKYNWEIKSLYLYHPRAIHHSHMYNKTPEKMISENDSRIENCLKKTQ